METNKISVSANDLFVTAYQDERDSLLNLARFLLRDDQVVAWKTEQDNCYGRLLCTLETLTKCDEGAAQTLRDLSDSYPFPDKIEVAALRALAAVNLFQDELESYAVICLGGGLIETRRNAEFSIQLSRRIGRMSQAVVNRAKAFAEEPQK